MITSEYVAIGLGVLCVILGVWIILSKRKKPANPDLVSTSNQIRQEIRIVFEANRQLFKDMDKFMETMPSVLHNG